MTNPALDAAGFVLDVPLIGAAEAAERVLSHWQDGARLLELPDGRWVLTLPAPVRTRPDRAPGEPLRAVGGALVAAGADQRALDGGDVLLVAGGLTYRHAIAGMRPLDPAHWLDPTGIAVHRLGPVGTPAAPEPVEEDEALRPPVVDLRAAAGVRERSSWAARLLGERRPRRPQRPRPPRSLAGRPGDPTYPRPPAGRPAPPVWPNALFLAAVLCGALPYLPSAVERGESEIWSVIPVLTAASIGLAVLPWAKARRDRKAAAPQHAGAARQSGAPDGPRKSAAARRPRGQWLARLALRSPAGTLFQRRQARYVARLARSFRQRRWEDALRDAVRLAGDAGRGPGGLLALRLPARFRGALRPDPRERAGAPAAMPISGPTVHGFLNDLYREAAEALEREARIDEAAYVLADLLAEPAEAVALLERHGRVEQAAELAEGRGLPADQVVRLWWRAGQRERAVRIAHRRGAFAAAVERLAATDPQAARELRTAWAAHCREAGDRLGAVDAVWPDAALRPTAVGDLREAVLLGGAARGRALVHLLALGPAGRAADAATGPEARTAHDARTAADARNAAEVIAGLALATLAADAPDSERAAALTALATVPAADPAVDRQLATAALRAVTRGGGFGDGGDTTTQRARYTRLSQRADPLAAADLPKPRLAAPTPGTPLEVTAADRPGTLPVLDAARLDSGAVLVACGHAGVRLLGPDGRTRARWDVPADELVLADHGGSALLVARYGEVRDIARLDLVTRAVERWTTLRVRGLARSYDGRRLVTVDPDGTIAVLDTRTARPTVVHRELGGDQRLLGAIARTPDSCAGLVHTHPAPGSHRVEMSELWQWEQPDWTLRGRSHLNRTGPDRPGPYVADLDGAVLLADGRLLDTGPGAAADTTLVRAVGDGRVAERSVRGQGVLSADGTHWAFAARLSGALHVTLGGGPPGAPLVGGFTAVFPGADASPVGLRRHGDALTCWHRSGRLFATTPDGATLLANLRVTTGS
ncbi:bpX6 domain-containing protein [Streptomyces sp. Y1]|uniref:BpX6 domain-containing protein n=1 Tax=Streptomyces sp. Y1 TaxID=3238634 RepID=A0AB39TCK0_9ACTN